MGGDRVQERHTGPWVKLHASDGCYEEFSAPRPGEGPAPTATVLTAPGLGYLPMVSAATWKKGWPPGFESRRGAIPSQWPERRGGPPRPCFALEEV